MAAANDCMSAVQVYTNQPLRIAGFSQVIISFVALVTFVYIYAFNFKQSLTPIHRNLKVLYFTTALLAFIHALFIIITESIHEYNRQLNLDDPCSLKWAHIPCIVLRSPILVTIPSFTLLHAGITIESLCATVAARYYEKVNWHLSVFLLLVISLFVGFGFYYVLKNAKFFDKSDYCLLSFVASGEAMSFLYKIVFFLNLPVTCMDLVLLLHNRKELDKTKNQALSDYKLSEVYQLRENIAITIRVTIPLVVCRMFTDSLYLLGQGTFIRAYFATSALATYTYIQTTYCLICLYTFFAIFIPYYCRLQKRRSIYVRPYREDTSAHFTQLNILFQGAYQQSLLRHNNRKLKI
ncbi:hypothetical protein M3Y97_00167200 [Aphelenchoides bicaudatus]|nr:hypothetical protein M3Y97_00167200 [Aphelenchoides bicaudatus]